MSGSVQGRSRNDAGDLAFFDGHDHFFLVHFSPMSRSTLHLLIPFLLLLCGYTAAGRDPVTIYLVGDSTMADYADNYEEGKDYFKTRYPVTGWGQVFQECFTGADLSSFRNLFTADSVRVVDRARGGRSTRTFFQEGRWRAVYENLREGDLVIIQFGHNDAAENKPERYVNIGGYKGISETVRCPDEGKTRHPGHTLASLQKLPLEGGPP